MKRFFVCVSILLLVACARPEPEQQLLNDAVYQVIVPAHDALLKSSKALTRRSQQFCDAPQDAAALDAVHSAWFDTMRDWQAVKMISFGPVLEGNLAWQLQFWPDKKNLVRSKIEAFLAAEKPMTVEQLAEESVTIQGLSAVEYLLYDEQGKLSPFAVDDADAARRCQLLFVTARHIERVATSLHQGWIKQGYMKTLLEPGEANALYPTRKQAVEQLLAVLVSNLEQVKKYNIEAPMGLRASKVKANPYLNEAWRSRLSRELLLARLQALHEFYRGGEGYGFDDYLRATPGHEALADSIEQSFNQAISWTQQGEQPLFDVIATDPSSMQPLLVEVSSLLTSLRFGVVEALGLTLGFNANDGD